MKLARPDRPAVCVTSDGSFMMFPGAVATAVEHDIPAVWVILNNYTIGVIRDLQRFYMDNREIGTSFMKHSTGEFWNPDFADDGRGDGCRRDLGRPARRPRRTRSTRRSRPGKPYVVDVKVNRDTAVPLIGTWQFPPIAQAEPTFGKRLVITLSLRYFPFTAIVEQERLKRALLLNAVNPAVGGVLIVGPSGHGEVDGRARARRAACPRSTSSRDCPFSCSTRRPVPGLPRRRDELPVARRRRRIVDLPLNATEDRVAGTVDIARALREGERALEPGLLAEANRGILYVDEINLLDDHLTDILLDAAALGVNVVEREGVSIAHPARFLLVGTMNEEEGELRPQIADRIGLRRSRSRRSSSRRRAPRSCGAREAFTADPEAFRASSAEAGELAEALGGPGSLGVVGCRISSTARSRELVVGSGVTATAPT